MRILFACVSLSLFALGAHSTFQQPEEADSCRFTVSGSKPPRSRAQMVMPCCYGEQYQKAAQLKTSSVSVDHERFSDRLRWTRKCERDHSKTKIRGAAWVTSRQFQARPNQDQFEGRSGALDQSMCMETVTQSSHPGKHERMLLLTIEAVPFKLGGSINKKVLRGKHLCRFDSKPHTFKRGLRFCSITNIQNPAAPAAKCFRVCPLIACWSNEKICRSSVSKIFAST